MTRTFVKQNFDENHNRAWMVPMLLAVGLAVALGGGSAAFGQCQNSVQEIVGPGCPPWGTPAPLIATGLNDNGEVVGHYRDCSDTTVRRPFYWSEQTGLIALPFAGGVVSARPYDINDNQQIVGEHLVSGIGWRGFMYDMLADEFHFLEPKFGVGMAVINAINNEGIAVGARSITKAGNNPHNAVIWDTNTGKITDLGVMQGPNSWASDINELAEASGGTGTQFSTINQQGWVRTLDGQLILLGPIPNGVTSGAAAINRFGTVASGGNVPGGQPPTQPAKWKDGSWKILPLPDTATGGGALAINDAEQIGGRILLGGTTERGILWQYGEYYLLSDLVDSDVNPSHLERIRIINNAGQLLIRFANTRGGLLTPVDVPVGDLNFDCRVDVHDLTILLNSWGPVSRSATGARGSKANPNADLNGDGVVDGTDLLILLSNWTF